MSQQFGGFCEINLNTGCPSALVSSRCFGARLMLEPERVRDICANIIRRTESSAVKPVEVTVKCRIGVDDCDSYEELHRFVTTVASAGVRHFIVHARKCLLNGLSPHENRTVPPLKYEFVYRLKEDFPHLCFTLNGGVASIQHAKELLDSTNIDGVMIGRAAYNTPWNLRDADRLIFGEARNPNLSRREIIERYLDYAEALQAKWGVSTPAGDLPYCMPTSSLMKPLLALFKCVPCIPIDSSRGY
jgi:tRNA-dihydrouridine synthase A